MAFFECEFPTTISYKAMGGPGFLTTINKGFSGQEQRNKNWALSRGKWSVSLITPAPADYTGTRQQYIDQLQAFFLNVSGQGDSFRLKDHKDFKVTGQTLGVGDGTTTAFQLVKTYIAGGRTYTRTIAKPITSSVVDYLGNALANTVNVYLNSALQSSGYTLDYTTGIITFTSAPGAGVIVSADCQFHFPVRFDSDDLPIQIEESDVAGGNIIASVNSVQLIEVRPPNY